MGGGNCGEYSSEDLVYMTKNGVAEIGKTATVFIAPRLMESGEEEDKTYFVRWFGPNGSELVTSDHGNLGAAHFLYTKLRLAGNLFYWRKSFTNNGDVQDDRRYHRHGVDLIHNYSM